MIVGYPERFTSASILLFQLTVPSKHLELGFTRNLVICHIEELLLPDLDLMKNVTAAIIVKRDGRFYLQDKSRAITWAGLWEGFLQVGKDSLSNPAASCPNCHRNMLREVLRKIEEKLFGKVNVKHE